MILGTKARYAVMAMVELAMLGQAKPVTLAQLAASQEIPLPYLEQLFARLRKAGLVKSSRGPGGGYTLAKTSADTSIAAIVEATEEPLKMTRCEGHAEHGCMASRGRCATHELWEGLGNHIYGYLNGISLQDVAGKRNSVMKPSRFDATMAG